MTGRHQGPKQKLRAVGLDPYREPSLQRMSCLCNLLLCCTSFIYHRRVWYHALSLCMRALCAYLTFGHHPHPLGYPCAKFRFCCAIHCWASPQRKINHSPSLFDISWTEAFASEQLKNWVIFLTCNLHISEQKMAEMCVKNCQNLLVNLKMKFCVFVEFYQIFVCGIFYFRATLYIVHPWK